MRQVVCVLIRDSAKIEAFAKRALSITPDTAIRPGEGIFLEISKIRQLMDETEVCRQLEFIAEELETQIRIGLAEDSRKALVIARTGTDNPSVSALSDFLGPFRKDEDEFRHADSMAGVLSKLGINRILEFKKLSPAAISSRFGKSGEQISLNVQRSNEELWPKYHPPEKITASVDLGESETLAPCAEIEPLIFVIKRISKRLLAKLHGDRIGGVQLKLFCEDKTARILSIEFPLPQSTLGGMVPIIQEHISAETAHTPFSSLVEAISMEVLETAPGHNPQKNLFGRQEEVLIQWDSLVGRLRNSLGKERAFLAEQVDRYLPEKSWRPIFTNAIQEQTRPITRPEEVARPSRLLLKPEPLTIADPFLINLTRKKRWRVLKWSGPERLSGEWWEESAFERDYYRIVTANHEELWCFYDGLFSQFARDDENTGLTAKLNSIYDGQGTFYLHGFFD